MLTVYDLMLLKESIDDNKIIYIQYGKHEYVFKTISPKEYSQAKMLTTTKEELSDAICQIALIYPSEYDFSQSPVAGLSDSMSQHIIEESLLFNEVGVIDKFEECKGKLNTFLTQCSLFIKAAFPEYKLEEIENWNYERLMDMTAKAEFVLKIQGSDYEIQYNKEELKEIVDDDVSDRELVENGIDPMFYHSDKITLKKPFINYPIILGSSWNREDLIKDVRQQILAR